MINNDNLDVSYFIDIFTRKKYPETIMRINIMQHSSNKNIVQESGAYTYYFPLRSGEVTLPGQGAAAADHQHGARAGDGDGGDGGERVFVSLEQRSAAV